MAIRYNLWIDPDNTAQHRAVEADLERYFMERFADYLRIPANVTGHYGDRDRFAHGLHAGESFVR